MGGTATLDGLATIPEVVAVGLVAAGLVAAFLLRGALRRLGRWDRTERWLTPTFVGVGSSFVFWAVLVLALFAALRVLKIGQLSVWFDAAIDFVPRVLLAAFIVGVGHLLGTVAQDLARRVFAATSSTLPAVVYAIVMTIAIVTGVEHLGLNVEFITDIALIGIAVMLATVALAFALGARAHVANLVAGTELKGYSAGDRLRIGELEGVIVDISRTSIALASRDGIVTVPAARFIEEHVTRLVGDRRDE